jgi:hypothetical protein
VPAGRAQFKGRKAEVTFWIGVQSTCVVSICPELEKRRGDMVEDILIVVLASLVFLCFAPFDALSAQNGLVSRKRPKGEKNDKP